MGFCRIKVDVLANNNFTTKALFLLPYFGEGIDYWMSFLFKEASKSRIIFFSQGSRCMGEFSKGQKYIIEIS